MAKTFKLEVVTPERVVFSDNKVTSVVVPGSEGYFGVLAGHAPMMAQMAIGQLDLIYENGSTNELFVCDGFVEVMHNTVTVLAHTAELGKEIDIERAEKALQRAKERLASTDGDVDSARAQSALTRAITRLTVARKSSGQS